MKKSRLFLILLCLCCCTIFAQQVEQVQQKNFKYDMTKSNRPKSFAMPFAKPLDQYTTTAVQEEENGFEPIGAIVGNEWGVLNEFGSNNLIYFSSELDGDQFIVKTFDDEFNVDLNFSIEVPETANRVQLLDHYSSNYFTNDEAYEFLVYVHYFDGENWGPEGQISEVWVVNSEGEILNQLPGVAAWAKINNDGEKILFTYGDDEEEGGATARVYDPVNFDELHSYFIDGDLINNLMGLPFSFVEVDGEEQIAIVHYEQLLLDNATLELTPDNYLTVNLLDFDLEVKKTMTLDIQSVYDESELGQYVIPMADFGTFYKDNRYDITKDIFNDDDELEILYGITYYDMMGDSEWKTYRVASEDGELIHELNEFIVDTNVDMTEIEGEDNQIGMLIGEDGDPSEISFFDIESWEMVATFSAVYEGDLLSDTYNRIPYEDTYHYLINLGEPDEVEGSYYGVINEYTKEGELVNRQRLSITDDSVLFTPIMTSSVFKPNVFSEVSDDLYYLYVYLEEGEDGASRYNMVVASDEDDILAEFRGDTDKGKIVGGGLAMATDGSGFDKLSIQYENEEDYTQPLVTDFYALPLEKDLGVEEVENKTFKLYPNPTEGALHFSSISPVKAIAIYDITGRKVFQENITESQGINIAELAVGVYVAHLSLENGEVQKIKLIKK